MHLLSAREAVRQTEQAARSLAQQRLGPGDRIAVLTPELGPPDRVVQGQVATLALVWACLRSGVTPVLLHPLLTERERAAVMADSGAEILVAGARELIDFVQEGSGTGPELSDTPLGRPMHYTSGTTGQAKGVFADLTEREAADYWSDEVGHWGFDRDDVMLVHSPLAHSAPLRLALCALSVGGTVALAGKFEAAKFARVLTAERPSTAFTVPTQLQQLLALPGGPPPSTYRKLIHAGSACPSSVKRAVHDWAGTEHVLEFYSSTEGHFSSCPGPAWEERPGTVGQARPGRTLSVDAEDVVWCAPPEFCRFQYWQDPEKTRRAWQETPAGSAFTVGDIGRIDDDGYLYLEGRREDLIISGGVNVYPAEVEAAILTIHGVRDVVVHGAADDRWGQIVCASYVGDVSPDDLRESLGPRLAKFKIPKVWTRMDEIPRNSMGKVQRDQLPTPP